MNKYERFVAYYIATIVASKLGLISHEDGNHDIGPTMLGIDFEKMNPANFRPEVSRLINERITNANDDFTTVYQRLLESL